MCDRWRGGSGFINFLHDMGEPKEGESIERKDPYGDYTPENCCWIPLVDQAKNRRYNWKIKDGNGWITAREISRRHNLTKTRISDAMNAAKLDKHTIYTLAEVVEKTGITLNP